MGQGAEVTAAARFAEAARNEKPTSKGLEEEVNRRQYTIMQWEEGKKWTPWKPRKKAEAENRTSQGQWRDTLSRHNSFGRRDFEHGEGVVRGGQSFVASRAGMEKDRSQRAVRNGCCQE